MSVSELFGEYRVVVICMFATMALGILMRVVLGILYDVLIRETDNMAVTENKLLKSCKARFVSCYELGDDVPNVSAFVDRFICRLSFGPFSFSFLYHLSGQLMLLSVIFSGIGVCIHLGSGGRFADILPFYIASLGGLYLYFSVATVNNTAEKRRILKAGLVDYLENHFMRKLAMAKQDSVRIKTVAEDKLSDQEQKSFSDKELEELLMEFLA